MTQDGAPGLTGPQGTPTPLRRAPNAWSRMMYQWFGAADKTGQTAAGQLARAQRARAAMLRPKR